MKKNYLLLFFVSLLFTSCSNEHNPIIDDQGTNLVFFTDDGHYEKEISYYDAILELRKTYPTLVSKMKVVTPNDVHKLNKNLQVDKFPALMIVNKNEVIFSIEGALSKEEIVDPILLLLSSN
ncbi:hypothetical protein GCM10008967_14620 [Bacillus carboniphilus]|uniref:Small peptidoglycan-associated lipoprotein n=1 Tax=Bacillus carboniphilus TaxID=86663 RepID=A0ABP3FT25_9BACI